MFGTISIVAFLVFLAATFWAVACLVRMISKSSRASAKRQFKFSCLAAVIAIPVTMIGAFNQYRDYGLESADGLQAAIAAERVQRDTDTATRAASDAQAATERAAREAAERTERDCNDTTMAFVMSQTFVKDRLRAPSTAQFPGLSEAAISKLGECAFRVISHVDAQNAFSAMIRTRYQVDLNPIPGTNRWTLTDIVMEDR